MIVAVNSTQPIDSMWHEVKCVCPQAHVMKVMNIEISRIGNLRLAYVCVECKAKYSIAQSIKNLENESCQLDMFSLIEENPLPIVVQLGEVEDEDE